MAQGGEDSLSPMHFNIIIDAIIREVRNLNEFKVDNYHITILSQRDYTALIDENEDDPQRFLYKSSLIAMTFNILISSSKTNCVTTERATLRC